jgi:transglutaminase-like putative cysteine protease
MRLSIRHTTTYHFDEPVVHALQRVRLTPKATQGQRILNWSMEYESAAEELTYEDEHHNRVVLVAVEEGARDVVIACRGTVETEDHAGVIGRHAGHLPLWNFLRQTDRTRPGETLNKLVESMNAANLSPIDTLHALSSAVRERVAYEIGTTDVGTRAEEAFAAGTGVCQDHAHIFIGVARALGAPARYISGYLMMNDRIEQDATHAWAEAYVDRLGWVGFDVSNGISPDQRYVRVATGRDYGEAAPITGISFGGAHQSLDVEVAVEQDVTQQ